VCTKSFHETSTRRLAYIKKTNFDAKKQDILWYNVLSFLHRPCVMLFFRKTFQTHMDYGDVHVKFLF
jgi:hypothetical protein